MIAISSRLANLIAYILRRDQFPVHVEIKPPKLVRVLSVLALIEKCPPAGKLPVAECVPWAVVHIASPMSVSADVLSAHEFCNGGRLITSTASGSNRVSGIALSGNGRHTPLLKHEKKSHTTLNPDTCPGTRHFWKLLSAQQAWPAMCRWPD
jgi:hypothetical protein